LADVLPILLIDDNRVVAHALASSLRSAAFPRVEVVDIHETPVDQIVDIATELSPALAILDVRKGEGKVALRLVGLLADAGNRVVMMSPLDDKVLLGECLLRGVDGMVNDRLDFDDAVGVLQRVMAGETVPVNGERTDLIEAALQARLAGSRPAALWKSLTSREREVLAELVRGRRVSEIAAAHFTSDATVRSHVKSILSKLDVRSQTSAVALALRTGWFA